ARRHFEAAVAFSRRLGDERSEALGLLGLALCEADTDLDSGIARLNSAFAIAIEGGHASLAAEILGHMARALVDKAANVDGPGTYLSRLAENSQDGALKDRAALERARECVAAAGQLLELAGTRKSSQLWVAEAKVEGLLGSGNRAIESMTKALE